MFGLKTDKEFQLEMQTVNEESYINMVTYLSIQQKSLSEFLKTIGYNIRLSK